MVNPRKYRFWGPGCDDGGYFPQERQVLDAASSKALKARAARIRRTSWVVRVTFTQVGKERHPNQPSPQEWQRIGWLDGEASAFKEVIFTDHVWTEVFVGKGKREKARPAVAIEYFLSSGKAAFKLRQALRASAFPCRVLAFIVVAGNAHGTWCHCTGKSRRCPIIADALALEG